MYVLFIYLEVEKNQYTMFYPNSYFKWSNRTAQREMFLPACTTRWYQARFTQREKSVLPWKRNLHLRPLEFCYIIVLLLINLFPWKGNDRPCIPWSNTANASSDQVLHNLSRNIKWNLHNQGVATYSRNKEKIYLIVLKAHISLILLIYWLVLY